MGLILFGLPILCLLYGILDAILSKDYDSIRIHVLASMAAILLGILVGISI